jgi:hypothetical protein
MVLWQSLRYGSVEVKGIISVKGIIFLRELQFKQVMYLFYELLIPFLVTMVFSFAAQTLQLKKSTLSACHTFLIRDPFNFSPNVK